MKKRYKILIAISVCCLVFSIPELIYQNEGKSKSTGSRSKGSLKNAWLMPLSGNNFSSFSHISYFLMKNGYTHSSTHDIVLDAYRECETTCPNIYFRYMECSNKHGGKMAIHRTHQHGLSVDFMVPKKNGKDQSTFWDRIGMWHYLLDFTDEGKLKLNKKVEIDFETMAKHILALDNAAKKHGRKIKMVILKIELKDDFFKTPSGKKVRQRGIYFARNLDYWVNRVHDDHYHVDFE